MEQIEELIKNFIEVVNQKASKIKEEEFYKLNSPLELGGLFKKKP